MNGRLARNFTDVSAERKATPLFIGLFSPTGAGKTFSALRLGTGIQRVSGGEIFGIDTESNRMLHYAPKAGEAVDPARGKFKFRHVPFGAPFSPLDYLDVINYCVDKGAKTIIVDSTSHEHEGAGGVLEWHDAETERLAKLWKTSEAKAQMAAWKEPKEARRKLINRILQVNANFIFCYRAKPKLRIVPGKDPVEMGYMPIGGDELFFEMTTSCLLLPMAKGVPNWTSDFPGEKAMCKLPLQFEELFGKPKQLDEDTGEQLARWAAGVDEAPPFNVDLLANAYAECATPGRLADLEKTREGAWVKIDRAAKQRLSEASKAAKERLAKASEVSMPQEIAVAPTESEEEKM